MGKAHGRRRGRVCALKDEGRYDVTLTWMNCAPNSMTSPSREKTGRPFRPRGAHHRRVRGNPALCRAARPRRHSMARIATSSNGFTPCALTACARLRNAGRFLRRSIIKACLAGAAVCPACNRRNDGRRRTACRTRGRGRRVRHHRASACPHQRRKAGGRGNCQSQSCADFDHFKPLFAAGSERSARRHAADASLRELEG